MRHKMDEIDQQRQRKDVLFLTTKGFHDPIWNFKIKEYYFTPKEKKENEQH